jgi:hypothetical protein
MGLLVVWAGISVLQHPAELDNCQSMPWVLAYVFMPSVQLLASVTLGHWLCQRARGISPFFKTVSGSGTVAMVVLGIVPQLLPLLDGLPNALFTVLGWR